METATPNPIVEVVAFGHNRGAELGSFARDLHSYLSAHPPAVWLLITADNGSTDDSWSTATVLAESLPNVRAARLEQRLDRKELRLRWNHSQGASGGLHRGAAVARL